MLGCGLEDEFAESEEGSPREEGGDEGVLRFLAGPRRKEIVEGIRGHYFNAGRAETCLFSDDGGLWPEIVGRTLRDVADNILHTADYAETAAQVLLRWCIQSGTLPLVKSVHRERIRENLAIFDFELDAQEMDTLTKLPDARFGSHPDKATF